MAAVGARAWLVGFRCQCGIDPADSSELSAVASRAPYSARVDFNGSYPGQPGKQRYKENPPPWSKLEFLAREFSKY